MSEHVLGGKLWLDKNKNVEVYHNDVRDMLTSEWWCTPSYGTMCRIIQDKEQWCQWYIFVHDSTVVQDKHSNSTYMVFYV